MINLTVKSVGGKLAWEMGSNPQTNLPIIGVKTLFSPPIHLLLFLLEKMSWRGMSF